ncbi:type III-A CRISPR-associated protein Csm2 [Fusobacterium hominis]|uniref:type III-A CRISPR-associated protein Csm2 n=1 Tax=Fusobacterium hominis TaxID=2764326 RepID=UPI0015A3E3D7|nr:type III-A CRISPR-associated protein Csm2 [Fusobacterium hominis]
MENLNERNYVNLAEKVMNELKRNGKNGNLNLTTSQIRNLLAITSDIYNDVINHEGTKLSDSIISRINYLKVRCLYEAGRDKKVEQFVKQSELKQHIENIGDSKEKFILYCRYMEALVAYHRYLGGRNE